MATNGNVVHLHGQKRAAAPEPERPATIIGSAGPVLIERWDDGTLSLTFSGPGFHGTNGVEMGTVGQLVTALSELPEDALLDELVVTYHGDGEDEGQPWPDDDHGNFIAVLGVRPREATGPGYGPYVYTEINGKTVYLHEWVMGSPAPGHKIVHVNGDTLDNRRENLAVVPESDPRPAAPRGAHEGPSGDGVPWSQAGQPGPDGWVPGQVHTPDNSKYRRSQTTVSVARGMGLPGRNSEALQLDAGGPHLRYLD